MDTGVGYNSIIELGDSISRDGPDMSVHNTNLKAQTNSA